MGLEEAQYERMKLAEPLNAKAEEFLIPYFQAAKRLGCKEIIDELWTQYHNGIYPFTASTGAFAEVHAIKLFAFAHAYARYEIEQGRIRSGGFQNTADNTVENLEELSSADISFSGRLSFQYWAPKFLGPKNLESPFLDINVYSSDQRVKTGGFLDGRYLYLAALSTAVGNGNISPCVQIVAGKYITMPGGESNVVINHTGPQILVENCTREKVEQEVARAYLGLR